MVYINNNCKHCLKTLGLKNQLNLKSKGYKTLIKLTIEKSTVKEILKNKNSNYKLMYLVY